MKSTATGSAIRARRLALVATVAAVTVVLSGCVSILELFGDRSEPTGEHRRSDTGAISGSGSRDRGRSGTEEIVLVLRA